MLPPPLKSPLFILFSYQISGQIIIFHQPRFPWNKGISLTKPPFGGNRSCEVAIIWPDYIYVPILWIKSSLGCQPKKNKNHLHLWMVPIHLESGGKNRTHWVTFEFFLGGFVPKKNRWIVMNCLCFRTCTPENLTNVPWKSMVGRCISYWNSPFLGDILIFRGVNPM